MLQRRTLSRQISKHRLARVNLARQLQPRDQATLALHRMVDEVGTDRRAENLRQQSAQAFAEIDGSEHMGTESQMIPCRQQLFEFALQRRCINLRSVGVEHANLRPSLTPVLLKQSLPIGVGAANARRRRFDLDGKQILDAKWRDETAR